MLARNFLQAGDFVEPIPLGLPITLCYSESGNLSDVFLPLHKHERCTQIFSALIKQCKVPARLNVNNGTAFVSGVIYTGKSYSHILGELPQCIKHEIISDIVNGSDFNFLATRLSMTSMNFIGAMQVRTWLKIHGFNVLPGYIVGNIDSDKYLNMQIEQSQFDLNEIVGFVIFRKDEVDIHYLKYRRSIIETINTNLDESGYLQTEIKFYNSSEVLTISKFEAIKFKLKENSTVILDSCNNIVFSVDEDNTEANYQIQCPVCGGFYTLKDEFTKCKNKHCFSRNYDNIIHFLTRLDLPYITYERYLNAVNDIQIKKFSDILSLSEFSDIELSTSIFDIIDAVIPISEVRFRDNIWKFYSQCNGSLSSITYYMEHPQLIASDLNIEDEQLISWFSDVYNRNTVFEVLNYSNIILTSDNKKFEGTPIFRNKKIYLTGKFKLGTISEVSAILRSFAAQISDYKEADCCIIGSIPEDIDGIKVNYIKSKELPVFDEVEFFNLYDLYSEIQ